MKKYFELRTSVSSEQKRFFMRFQNGKCINQPVGKNSFSTIPSKIATLLNLDNPEKYTGHSFRRTSATLLANTGVDVLALKRHGGWKSGNIAEGYVADSITNKNDVANKILYNKFTTVAVNSLVATSFETWPSTSIINENVVDNNEVILSERLSDDVLDNHIQIKKRREEILPNFVNNVSNCSNCTINITFN